MFDSYYLIMIKLLQLKGYIMKLFVLIFGAVLVLGSTLIASENTESLFDVKCAICHSKTRPADISKVTAPAMMGVMKHVKMAYPKKEEAVKFIVDYVFEPSKSKALCIAQKIEKFGLMPSQKDNISGRELKEVAGWVFDHFPPKDFSGMKYRQENMLKDQGK